MSKLIPDYSMEVKTALRDLSIIEDKEIESIQKDLLTKFSDSMSTGYHISFDLAVSSSNLLRHVEEERNRIKAIAIPVGYSVG